VISGEAKLHPQAFASLCPLCLRGELYLAKTFTTETRRPRRNSN